MKQTTRTSYTASQILMEIIMDHGTSPDTFEALTGVQHSRITDPDGWIPMASFVRLWELAIDATGDPALALRLRKKTGMRSIHFVVQLAMHCSTLAEALLHFNKYSSLLSETDNMELSDNGDLIDVTYTNASPYQVRWLPEHNFSFGIELGRSLVSGSYDPVCVSFQHADPGYKDVYEDVFRAPVLFQQPENMITLRKIDLLKPITARDPYLKNVLMNYAELSMKKKYKQQTLQEKIESFIVAGLPKGETTLDAAAAAMNMARSTLYRQLKTEGTSFQELLLKTRQELAKNHLRNGMTNSQIAYLLGFSEPSAFHRAFKRWYNISPGEHRKSVQG